MSVSAPLTGVVESARGLTALDFRTLSRSQTTIFWLFAFGPGDSQSAKWIGPVAARTTSEGLPPAPPELLLPEPGGTFDDEAVFLSWSADSRANKYDLRIGTKAGAADVFDAVDTSNLSVVATGLPTDGRALYVRLVASDSVEPAEGGYVVNVDYVLSAFDDGSPPAAAEVTSHAAGSQLLEADETFTWSWGARVTEYDLLVGRCLGCADVFAGFGLTGNSVDVIGLPRDEAPLYVTLTSRGVGDVEFVRSYEFSAPSPPLTAGNRNEVDGARRLD